MPEILNRSLNECKRHLMLGRFRDMPRLPASPMLLKQAHQQHCPASPGKPKAAPNPLLTDSIPPDLDQ
jgi:hypothetical protein